ncbi:hypothetical protein ACQ4PT_013676 [Festuca glaucescens]
MGSPSTSSQSRRWADYTDDEEEEVSRRSYCEVLRSGTPPDGSGAGVTPSPPSVRSGARSPPLAPSGVVPPVAAAAVGGRWAVDDSTRRLASLVAPPSQAPAPAARDSSSGAGPWMSARGRKRSCNQPATLPAWTVRSGIPTNLAGACFNCTRTCHISAECTYETVCLRCGEEGHHARECPQNRRAGGDRRGGRGHGPVVPVHQRLGPRVQERVTDATRDVVPPDNGEPRVEAGTSAPAQERYRIPAHQRLGLGAPQLHRSARSPSPPPVESVGSRIPAHQRLGERGRDQPPPPPVQEAAGSSSRHAARGRPAGGGLSGRGASAARSPAADRNASPARSPRPTADVHDGRASSRSGREKMPRWAAVESVFVPRSGEINAAEAALRYALVAFVSGKRAYIPLSEAGAALAARVPRAEDNFTVHRAWPADFLFVCSSRRVRDEVMAADATHGRDFSLRFTPWNRQLQAMQCRMRFRAHFELKGVPALAWNRSTATAVLSSNAWVECLGAATANREDLGRFQVVAWTNDVSVFPKEKEMLIEEPDDLMEEDEGMVLPGDALTPLENNMLRYLVSIRVAHAEDMLPADEDGDGRDDGAGDEGDGRCDRDSRGGHDGRGGHEGRRREEERGWGCERGNHRSHSRSRHEDALRRRPPGGGWGGSRPVAINTEREVTPWPEVEDEVDVESAAAVAAGRGPMSLSAESSPRMHATTRVGPGLEPLHGATGRASPGPPRGDTWKVKQDMPGRFLHSGPTSAVQSVSGHTLDQRRSGSPTPELTRAPVEEDDWEEGEYRAESLFESVVKSSEVPSSCQAAAQDRHQNCQLSDSGLLSSPTSNLRGWPSPDDSVASVQRSFPRSAFEVFPVSISPSDKGFGVGPRAVDFVKEGMGQDLALFRDACKRPISPVLGRPARRCRQKKIYSGPVRRSGRIRGRFVASTPIRQQQRALMVKLGIAHEGETIGDEALDAYLDLFSRPFRPQHLDVVLRLFGWTSEDLPLSTDAPVDCLM